MKVNKVLVITDNDAQIKELVSAAKIFGEEVALIYSGNKESALGAERAFWLGEMKEESFVNFIPGIIKFSKDEKPDIVILGNTSNCRLTAAHLAVATDTAVLTDVSAMQLEDDGLRAERMVYGGAAIKTDKSSAEMKVVILSPGALPVTEQEKCDNISTFTAPGKSVVFRGKTLSEKNEINLAVAKRVIAVGRGVPKVELLENINDIAASLSCAVGCTRPVAEENHWLPKATYIGVSGVMLKPDLYIGLGVSGQVQHMVGINTARTIFAVDKDKNAPIFKQCDYGLIADNAVVLPMLAEKLKNL